MESRPGRGVVPTLGAVLLGLLLAALDQTVVGTAMPRIIAELHGFEQYAWVATSYMLTSTAIVPIVGKLSDLYGRKGFYLAGLVVFLIGSALSGAASSMTALVIFRGIQGLGAGVLMSIAFIVIGDLFSPAERGRLQGLFAAVWGLAALVGPPLGGYLTDALSWRWVFYVNLPVGLAALVVVALFFPPLAGQREHGGIDYAGALTLVAGSVALLLALSWGGRAFAWGSPMVIGLLAGAVVLLAAFAAIEARAAEPIIPPRLFTNRVIAVSVVASFALSIGMFGTILFAPLFIQSVLGASAAASGNVMLPMMGGLVLASVGSGWAISRTGRYRLMANLGLATMVVGLLWMSRLSEGAGLIATAAALAVVGIGLGTTFPVFTIAIQNAAPPEMLGAATATAQFFRQIGGTIGAAVLGALMARWYDEALRARLARVGVELPADQMALLLNPQVVLGGADSGGLPAFGALAAAVRGALATALDQVFLVGALAVAISLAASFLLPEVPLRRGRFARSAVAVDPTPQDVTQRA